MEKFSTATVTRDSVFKAIEQFDRIGQHAFLEKFALGQGAQKGNKVSGATSKAARCQVTGTFTTLAARGESRIVSQVQAIGLMARRQQKDLWVATSEMPVPPGPRSTWP